MKTITNKLLISLLFSLLLFLSTNSVYGQKSDIPVACPRNINVPPPSQLYDCSNGSACYNDFEWAREEDKDNRGEFVCFKDPRENASGPYAGKTYHCDQGNASFLGKGTVTQNCTGTGKGWVGDSGCGNRNDPANQASDEYDCSRGLRCFNDYFRDESTSCEWRSKENITDPYAGKTYHCDPDPKCGNPTDAPKVNKVVRDQFLDDYIETASAICGEKQTACRVKVQKCIKQYNDDANNGDKLDECVRNVHDEVLKDIAVTYGQLSISRSQGNEGIGLTAAGTQSTDLELFVSDLTGTTSKVFASGQKVDIGVKLITSKHPDGCVPGEEIRITLDGAGGPKVAAIPTCYSFQNYPLPETPGKHVFTAYYSGNDKLESALKDFEFEISDKPSVQTSTFARVNGEIHAEVSPDDGIFFAGKAVVGDSEDNECTVDEISITLYKSGGISGQNQEIWSKPRAVNCATYNLWDESGIALDPGIYILNVKYKGNQRILSSFKDAFITVTKRPKIPTNTTVTGSAKGVSTKAKKDQKISLNKLLRNVAGISAIQQGDSLIITNDPNSLSQGIVLTPCTTPEVGSSSEIPTISVLAKRINEDVTETLLINNPAYPNCSSTTIPINDLTNLDRIEVTASFLPPAGSPFGPSSKDLEIDADENTPPVQEKEDVKLTSFPAPFGVDSSDTVVDLVAYTDTPVDNPTFKITDEAGNVIEIPADSETEGCSDENGTCIYAAPVYYPEDGETAEFCANGVCDEITFNPEPEVAGEITGVDLILDGQVLPLSLDGSDLDLFLGDSQQTVVQIVIHHEGLPDQRRSVTFIYEPGEKEVEPQPEPQPEPTPEEQSIPSCPDYFQYNECTACNTSRSVFINSCTGEFSTGDDQEDSDCSSYCEEGGQ